MRRTIDVLLGGEARPVGTLRYDAQGGRESAAFEYAPEWISSGYPLAPELRLLVGPQFHRRTRLDSPFHDPIADTEPDGWGKTVILRDHAKQRQAARAIGAGSASAALTSLDYLLAVDDSSRVGALRFRDEQGVFRGATEEGRRTTPPLLELGALSRASRAVELNTETQADLAYLRGRGTSLGGLRPKCTVVDDDGRLAIGKFPSVQDQRAVTKGEVLALELARGAGIVAAEARIVDSEGVPVALIYRFDRAGGRRIPYISAATLIGADSTRPGEHAYTELVDGLRQHGADARTDIEELWRRIAFSILITNVDDHLHNHGFLHVERGLWRLAPAFDVNPFPDRARDLKTWISEETGPAASIEALLSVAPYFRVAKARALAILAEVNAAVDQWRAVGRRIGMTKAELDQFADAFEHDERAVARRGG